MNRRFEIVAGAGAGAGVMYLLDPVQGGRRRALLRDKAVKAVHIAQEGAETVWRDARNRMVGALVELRKVAKDEPVSDDVLVERIRARLGTLVSHPRSIEVEARDGGIVLTGPVLANEVDDLIEGVRRVRGVRDVKNALEVHPQADNVPGLQGTADRRRRQAGRFELLQERWAPAPRFAVGTAGAALILRGLRRRGLGRVAAAAAGATLVARAISNVPARRLLGAQSGHRAVDGAKGPDVDTVRAPRGRLVTASQATWR